LLQLQLALEFELAGPTELAGHAEQLDEPAASL
jgi:hypothetical protein